MRLTFLGSGDAFGSGGRLNACFHLERAAHGNVLIDCGATSMVAIRRGQVDPNAVSTVLVSHLHGDHFGGLPFLILEYMFETPLRKNLVIAGPRHLEQRTWALFRVMYPEFDTSKIARKLKFVELAPGKSTRLGRIKVDTVRTPHTVKDISLAFRIEAAGKTIAFSGDTGWTEGLIPLSADADLFLSECTYFKTQTDFHLSYPMIAANRGRFSARRMVLTHLGREMLEKISKVEFEMASDGMTIDL